MSLRGLLLILRVVAWLAPAGVRDRWREEWLAEINHVARERGARTAARVALGAAPDAFSLRRLTRERAGLRASDHGKGPMLGISSTDFKLALRMLVRYPGLTLVGVFGMAVGITIAAGAFTIVSAMMNPALPFEEGDRIVAIGNWHVRTNNQEQRVLHDFATWRTGLLLHRGHRRVPHGQPQSHCARRTAGDGARGRNQRIGVRVTRVSPSIGRHLLPEDERADAPDVVVIGDDVWRRRFAADPRVLGREVQLGSRPHTIVGVMPAGYRFPAAHSF